MKHLNKYIVVSVVLMIISAFFSLLFTNNYFNRIRLSYYEPVENALIFDRINSFINVMTGKLSTSTSLPTYRISVDEGELDKLFSNLPNSGDQEVDAKIQLPGFKDKLSATLRLRGDSHWHWNYPKKSWRISVNDKTVASYKINLVNSRFRSHVLFGLEYDLVSKAGVLGPRHNFVSLYINGKYQGVYDDIEQIDGDFLARRGFDSGALFDEEFDGTKYDVKVDEILGVYSSIILWPYKGPKKSPTSNDLKQLQKLINLALLSKVDSNTFIEIEKIVDVDKILKFVALMNLLNSAHVNNFANGKVFLNPISNKFEPVAWDYIGHFQSNLVDGQVSVTFNRLFQQILRNPKWMAQKNKNIIEMMNGFASKDQIISYIENSADLIEHDIFFDPLKDYVDFTYQHYTPGLQYGFWWPHRVLSFSGWKTSINFLKKWIELRADFVKRTLASVDYSAYLLDKNENLKILTVDVRGEAGMNLELPLDKYRVYRDLNFDGQLSGSDVELLDSQIDMIYPGISLLNPETNVPEFRLSAQRYQYLLFARSRDDQSLLSKIKFSSLITDEAFDLQIKIINSLIELPETPYTNSLHPWK